MTRIGVMKHLRILETAGLVTTKRRGREKLHFLNAVPIRLVHDRWVSKYAEPWAATLTGLKTRLEKDPMEKVFEIYIKTTPERLWEAITDPELRSKYSFGVCVESDWKAGSSYEAVHPAAPAPISAGENLEVEPPATSRPELQRPVERRRQGRGHFEGHLGDRAHCRFVPADRHPRPAARGRQRRALRRLADDPLRPQDAAGDRGVAHDAWLAHVLGGLAGCLRSDERIGAPLQLGGASIRGAVALLAEPAGS